MNSDIKIRAFTIDDYVDAYRLWASIEGLGLNESDTPEAIATFLGRNPGLSAVAIAKEKLIGTILSGHNGRAGHITHLAVTPEYRSQGVGRNLVDYALAQLIVCRIPRCNIFVYNGNHGGNRFWLENGWTDPTTWRVLQKRM